MNKSHQIDLRWFLAGGLMIVFLIIAIIINHHHELKDATKFISSIDIDNGDQKINWSRYATTDIALSESVNIAKPGIYHLTGTLNDGSVSISVTKDEPVKLILDNVTIKNSSGPAILCYQADDLVIELVGTNTLEDGVDYDISLDEDIRGAIYSKSDTTFEGSGTLNLTANKEDAIISKDDLKFISGTYNITSVDDSIRGKDSVYITAGKFNINSGADAIKSTDNIDSGKGFVLIESGTFNIESGAKAIKAVSSVLIYNGNFTLNTYDDAIHSDNYVGIVNGTYQISSGDDGIHANRELIIDGGKINITKAYEGLEAQVVTINNGEVSLNATDDGINAGGGADASVNNRKGAGAFDADLNCVISINGGKLYINASGDGVDSNGYLYFNGGETIVDGPTNNGNGSLDAGAGIVMNGGKVIAVGASGMAEALGQSSSVYNISVYFPTSQAKNTTITIKNRTDETILSHTSAKTFSHLAAGSTNFTPGETYTIYLNDEKYEEFTIENIVTTLGDAYNNQPGQPGQPMMPTSPERH